MPANVLACAESCHPHISGKITDDKSTKMIMEKNMNSPLRYRLNKTWPRPGKNKDKINASKFIITKVA